MCSQRRKYKRVLSKERKPREPDKVGKNQTKWEEKGDNGCDCYEEWRRRNILFAFYDVARVHEREASNHCSFPPAV